MYFSALLLFMTWDCDSNFSHTEHRVWGYMSSGVWCFVIWWVVLDLLKVSSILYPWLWRHCIHSNIRSQ